jgi:excisionase family DNA binding protein
MPQHKDLIVPTFPVAEIPRLALTPRETGQALGVSERTVNTWISEEILPSTKIGRCRLIPVDSLRQWLVERVADGGATLGDETQQATDEG